MSSLLARVRLLVNDPIGASCQAFSDQEIQDVLDASRADVRNQVMIPKPTFTGSTIQFLDYYTELGDWEDDVILKQYLIDTVTPDASELIAGHWSFSETTLPPIYITGKTYDLYRCAADLLERMAARWVLSYNIAVDGQNLQRSQVVTNLQNLAKTYRMKQRPSTIYLTRTDLRQHSKLAGIGLGPTPLDYMGDGSGR
jgi:hypothetical protein